jgi:hypothetical protein
MAATPSVSPPRSGPTRGRTAPPAPGTSDRHAGEPDRLLRVRPQCDGRVQRRELRADVPRRRLPKQRVLRSEALLRGRDRRQSVRVRAASASPSDGCSSSSRRYIRDAITTGVSGGMFMESADAASRSAAAPPSSDGAAGDAPRCTPSSFGVSARSACASFGAISIASRSDSACSSASTGRSTSKRRSPRHVASRASGSTSCCSAARSSRSASSRATSRSRTSAAAFAAISGAREPRLPSAAASA